MLRELILTQNRAKKLGLKEKRLKLRISGEGLVQPEAHRPLRRVHTTWVAPITVRHSSILTLRLSQRFDLFASNLEHDLVEVV